MAEQAQRAPLTIAVRCDATRAGGVGHLVRQLALIEELAGRGHRVSFQGTVEVPWAEGQLRARGLNAEPVDGDTAFVDECRRRGVDVVMIDGYAFDGSLGAELSAAGIRVAAMVDGEFGAHQWAELYVDQNLGAAPSEGARGLWLVGPQYVLLRDIVRSRRGMPPASNNPPRILVVFGGTDPYRGAPVLADLLLSTGLAVHVVAVAAAATLADELRALSVGDGQSLEVLEPQDDLPGLALSCDAAVSAAGSTVWEFACLGVPTALVCVTDNQLLGYRAASEELCLPLGHLEELRADEAARALTRDRLRTLIVDSELRAAMAARARRIVDGEGRGRVADAIEELVRR